MPSTQAPAGKSPHNLREIIAHFGPPDRPRLHLHSRLGVILNHRFDYQGTNRFIGY